MSPSMNYLCSIIFAVCAVGRLVSHQVNKQKIRGDRFFLCRSDVLRSVVDHHISKGEFPWSEEQVKGVASHRPVVARTPCLEAAGLLTRRLSPVDIRQCVKEMWHRSVGVS